MERKPKKGFMTAAMVLALLGIIEGFVMLVTLSCYVNGEYLMMVFAGSMAYALFALALRPVWRRVNELT